MTARIDQAELSLLLVVLCAVVIPIAAVAFARSGRGLKELGKGTFAIDLEGAGSESPNPELGKAEQEAEVRQMVEAAAYRRRARGEPDLDVQSEIDRILGTAGDETAEEDTGAASDLEGGTAGVRAEIRQLVIANNERRVRRGEQPLDVNSEVERRFDEWA